MAGKGSGRFESLFGTWNQFVQAAGLPPNQVRTKKLTNQIFETKLETHLENFTPSPQIDHPPYPTMSIISDIHWPFENQRVIDKFLERVALRKPQYVFLNGDGWDMYSHTKFPRSHNIFTPREEQTLARQKNEEFWKQVQQASPTSKCIQLMGNHDVRPLKRIMEVYPQAEDWIAEKLKELFTYPNVETVMDPRQEYQIGDILIFHGYRSQLGAHRDYTLYNCINGHTHKAGVVFRRIRGQTIWEMNSGLAGNPEAKGLTYTPQRITEWTPAFAEVDPDGPRVIIV